MEEEKKPFMSKKYKRGEQKVTVDYYYKSEKGKEETKFKIKKDFKTDGDGLDANKALNDVQAVYDSDNFQTLWGQEAKG